MKETGVLSNSLLQSVQQGMKEDIIWTMMNADERDTPHETFNRRFDAMFGEDCWDSAGRLHYIRKGKHGLGLVCSFLSKLDWANSFPLDIVEIKLSQLVAELKQLQYIVNFSFSPHSHWHLPSGFEVDQPLQTRPSCHTDPATKLTDNNNTAKPAISFQAVEDFHTCQAKEAKSAPNLSIENHCPNVTSAIVDMDTKPIDCDKDEDTDDQPKPHMFSHVYVSMIFTNLFHSDHSSEKATHHNEHHERVTEKADHWIWQGHRWQGWSKESAQSNYL